MKHKRKQVNWLPGAKAEQKVLPAPPVYRTRDLTEDEVNELIPRLVLGSLWLTRRDLYAEQSNPAYDQYYAQHELKYVTPSPYGSRGASMQSNIIPAGTMAVYMGTVHVNEYASRGNICRILRHVFLVNGQRVMSGVITDEFTPVS